MKTLMLVVVAILASCTSCFGQMDKQALKEYQERNKESVETQQLMSQKLQLVYSEKLRNELSITEEQLNAIRPLAEEYQQFTMKMMTERQEEVAEAQKLMREGKTAEGIKLVEGFQSELAEFANELCGKANDVLLPHQLERIKQINKQQMSKFTTPYRDEFGVPFALADEIELTEDEKQDLKEAIEKARKEYYDGVAKLKKKANEVILISIPKTKRERLKEILGDRFDADSMFGAPIESKPESHDKQN